MVLRRARSLARLLLLLLGNLGCTQLLLFLPILSKTSLIVSLELLGEDHTLTRIAAEGALSLKHRSCDKTLDLRSFLFLLAFDLAAHDELLHVVLLLEVEQLSDVGRTLWSETSRLVVVSEARNILSTLLHDDQLQGGQVWSDNASTDRLAFAAAVAEPLVLAVARHALFEEQAHTLVTEDTLLHWESLFVVSARDLEHVAVELVTQSGAINL